MPLIPFPNVPLVPGVPLIPRSAAFPSNPAIALGLVQALLWQVFQTQSQWGIFNSAGQPIFNVDEFNLITNSVMTTEGVDYSKETKVSSFPIEQGSFASYNKVETPASPVVTLCFSGSDANRAAFINTIDTACKSTDLYSIATPEVTYINYSIVRYGYSRRNANNAYMYTVEIGLEEIREVSAQFTKVSQINTPKTASAVPPVDGGKVQAATLQQSTLKKLIGHFQ